MKRFSTFSQSTLICIVCLSVLLLSFRPPNAEEVNLPSGTSIQFELLSSINSKTARPGTIIDFRVSSDVKVKGKTLISGGSIAKGQVVRVQKSKALGQEGVIEIQVRSVKAVDGQDVILFGGNLFREGEDRQTLSIILGLICFPFGFLLKGESPEIIAGSAVMASVATPAVITVNQ
jgi:hypothetical protein